MAARFHPIYPTYWSEAKRQGWSDAAMVLGAYLLTCRHRTSEGLYQLPLMYAAHDLCWPLDKVKEAFAELTSSGFAVYDSDNEVVLVCNALRFHAPRGEKSVRGAVNALLAAPTTSLRGRFLAAAERHAPDLARALKEQGWRVSGCPIDGASDAPSADASEADFGCPIDGASKGDPSKPKPKPNTDIYVEAAASTAPPEARIARDLFDYWRARCRASSSPQPRFTADRRAKVLARLREGYSPDDIRRAIDGAAVAAFVDEKGKRFDDLELICRNGSKLESFIERGSRAVQSEQLSTAELIARRDRLRAEQAGEAA